MEKGHVTHTQDPPVWELMEMVIQAKQVGKQAVRIYKATKQLNPPWAGVRSRKRSSANELCAIYIYIYHIVHA